MAGPRSLDQADDVGCQQILHAPDHRIHVVERFGTRPESFGDRFGVRPDGEQALDTEIALAAAEACSAHKLATADAIIFATARVQGAALLTCDAHFDGLPGVTLIEKIKD
jgi:predicted nucleic acid-binding protein